MNKSQTLPRSMGGTRTTPTGTGGAGGIAGGLGNGGTYGGSIVGGGAGMPKIVPKPAATPPAIRRQFSVSIPVLQSISLALSCSLSLTHFFPFYHCRFLEARQCGRPAMVMVAKIRHRHARKLPSPVSSRSNLSSSHKFPSRALNRSWYRSSWTR